LVKGRIVSSGGAELADQLEIDGYAAFVGTEDDAPSGGALADLFG
jgi:Fe-S cluster assembly ATPase SufC